MCNTSQKCYVSHKCHAYSIYCPNIANAICVSDYCNHCSAKFYDAKGNDVTAMCSKSCHIMFHISCANTGKCQSGVKPVNCLVNPCEHIQYTNLPTEVDCVLDICGECRPRYYYNNAEVTEFCSNYNCIYCISHSGVSS